MNTIIITIGDEILNGQIIDTNSSWIAAKLNTLGIHVVGMISIKDERENIHRTLSQSAWFADLIILTGGLGPTSDDITKPTLAEYFGSNLVFNDLVFQDIQQVLAGRKIATLERNKEQANIPDNCIPLRNKLGTAPGMWFEKKGKFYVSLPGVPYEMKGLMIAEVLPRIQKKLTLPTIVHAYIRTVGIGESAVAEKLMDFEKQLPENIKLAYLPSLGGVKLRLTATGQTKPILDKQLNGLIEKIATLMPKYIYSYNEHQTLQERVGEMLLEQNLTLGTAESCTGGYLAHLITSIPGSSGWFRGSVVAYANEIKSNLLGVDQSMLETHGAVSEPVVKQMATGLLATLGVNYAIAVSGIAGPDGGTSEKPVGTVWIAVANRQETLARQFNFNAKRLNNIELSAVSALDMLRRFLKTHIGNAG